MRRQENATFDPGNHSRLGLALIVGMAVLAPATHTFPFLEESKVTECQAFCIWPHLWKGGTATQSWYRLVRIQPFNVPNIRHYCYALILCTVHHSLISNWWTDTWLRNVFFNFKQTWCSSLVTVKGLFVSVSPFSSLSWSVLAPHTTMEMKTRQNSCVLSPKNCITNVMAQAASQVKRLRWVLPYCYTALTSLTTWYVMLKNLCCGFLHATYRTP